MRPARRRPARSAMTGPRPRLGWRTSTPRATARRPWVARAARGVEHQPRRPRRGRVGHGAPSVGGAVSTTRAARGRPRMSARSSALEQGIERRHGDAEPPARRAVRRRSASALGSRRPRDRPRRRPARQRARDAGRGGGELARMSARRRPSAAPGGPGGAARRPRARRPRRQLPLTPRSGPGSPRVDALPHLRRAPGGAACRRPATAWPWRPRPTWRCSRPRASTDRGRSRGRW